VPPQDEHESDASMNDGPEYDGNVCNMDESTATTRAENVKKRLLWLKRYDPQVTVANESRIGTLERQLRIQKGCLRPLLSATTPDSLSIVTYMELAEDAPSSRFAGNASGECLGSKLSRRQSILETPTTAESEVGPGLTSASATQLRESPPAPQRCFSQVELLEVKNYDASGPNRHYQDMVGKHGRIVHLDLTLPPEYPSGGFEGTAYENHVHALGRFKEIVHFIGYRKQLLHHCAVTHTKSIWYLPCNKGKMIPTPSLNPRPST